MKKKFKGTLIKIFGAGIAAGTTKKKADQLKEKHELFN